MHKFCSLDFTITETRIATIAAASPAALYGKGIFTTVRLRNKKPFLWEKHWQRLLRDAERLGIELKPFSAELVASELDKVINANRLENGRARITFFSKSGGIWDDNQNLSPSLLILTADERPAPQAFRLTVSPYAINSTSPLAGIKSCNYLENLIALEDAKIHGFDEALRLNEKGEVAGAAMANVIWISGGVIYTTPLSSGCLAGTTREYLIEQFGLCEQKAELTNLRSAEKVFLVSSGVGIAEVAEIDGYKFTAGENRLRDVIAAIRSEME